MTEDRVRMAMRSCKPVRSGETGRVMGCRVSIQGKKSKSKSKRKSKKRRRRKRRSRRSEWRERDGGQFRELRRRGYGGGDGP